MKTTLRINAKDNLVVALKPLSRGDVCTEGDHTVTLLDDVPAKHKFVLEDIAEGGVVTLYGLPVGKATRPLRAGQWVNRENIHHFAAPVHLEDTRVYHWEQPDVSAWQHRTFDGYVRADGRVGTANYWLILPLVFCENHNAQQVQRVLSAALGYSDPTLETYARNLVQAGAAGQQAQRPFAHIDGIRCLTHHGGCGGTAADAERLCRVLAAYADHPNVAGITVFSLGCEKAQRDMFEQALHQRNPHFAKPALYYRQQDWEDQQAMLQDAVKQTLDALPAANTARRSAVPLSRLCLGVKCGGSDGFSGISANPVMGLVSDRLVTLGGASVLAEFPELVGAEGDLVARCGTLADRQQFMNLMRGYEARATGCGASMADNPSPGNIADGLITDAIKSTGAAKKAGQAPVSAVRDYAEPMAATGLTLSCTPGNDVEAVTGQVAAGATVVVFSTGLGTPTGNPIAPVIKISSNTTTGTRLKDMIDYDCGPVIDGMPLEEAADGLLEKIIAVASGRDTVKADGLHQYDFTFWRLDVSL